jgi:hypothetical protein
MCEEPHAAESKVVSEARARVVCGPDARAARPHATTTPDQLHVHRKGCTVEGQGGKVFFSYLVGKVGRKKTSLAVQF